MQSTTCDIEVSVATCAIDGGAPLHATTSAGHLGLAREGMCVMRQTEHAKNSTLGVDGPFIAVETGKQAALRKK